MTSPRSANQIAALPQIATCKTPPVPASKNVHPSPTHMVTLIPIAASITAQMAFSRWPTPLEEFVSACVPPLLPTSLTWITLFVFWPALMRPISSLTTPSGAVSKSVHRKSSVEVSRLTYMLIIRHGNACKSALMASMHSNIPPTLAYADACELVPWPITIITSQSKDQEDAC
jgi:hypothetical protein